MPNTEQTIMRIPAVPMTVSSLMQRPMAEIQNYESEVLPLLRLYANYKHSFIEGLIKTPGNFFGVVNFNLPSLEPDWCRQRLNLFDMKLARCLLGRKWSKKADSQRLQWIAVPERATFLHYNTIWDVPIEHQEQFFLEGPEIWRDVMPSGQFHLQVIGEESGETVASRIYCSATIRSPG